MCGAQSQQRLSANLGPFGRVRSRNCVPNGRLVPDGRKYRYPASRALARPRSSRRPRPRTANLLRGSGPGKGGHRPGTPSVPRSRGLRYMGGARSGRKHPASARSRALARSGSARPVSHTKGQATTTWSSNWSSGLRMTHDDSHRCRLPGSRPSATTLTSGTTSTSDRSQRDKAPPNELSLLDKAPPRGGGAPHPP
jgi:hypothetical protein